MTTDNLPEWWNPPPPRDACAGTGERVVLLLYAEALAALRRARITPKNRIQAVDRALAILALPCAPPPSTPITGVGAQGPPL